jgi:hypothetical protein
MDAATCREEKYNEPICIRYLLLLVHLDQQ